MKRDLLGRPLKKGKPGDIADAVKRLRAALAMAERDGNAFMIRYLKERLALFEKDRP